MGTRNDSISVIRNEDSIVCYVIRAVWVTKRVRAGYYSWVASALLNKEDISRTSSSVLILVFSLGNLPTSIICCSCISSPKYGRQSFVFFLSRSLHAWGPLWISVAELTSTALFSSCPHGHVELSFCGWLVVFIDFREWSWYLWFYDVKWAIFFLLIH